MLIQRFALSPSLPVSANNLQAHSSSREIFCCICCILLQCQHFCTRTHSPHLALLSQISITVQYSREHPQRGVTRLALVILHPEQPPHHQLNALNLYRGSNRTDTSDESRDIYFELRKENSDSSTSRNNTLQRGYNGAR